MDDSFSVLQTAASKAKSHAEKLDSVARQSEEQLERSGDTWHLCLSNLSALDPSYVSARASVQK